MSTICSLLLYHEYAYWGLIVSSRLLTHLFYCTASYLDLAALMVKDSAVLA